MGQQQQQHHLPLIAPRITNTGSELKLQEGNRDDEGAELVQLPDGTWAPRVALYEKYVDLGPQYQVPDPEKGPLERRVSVQFLDALFSDEINEEDKAYWFTCPPGGWDTEHKVLLKATAVDVPKSQQGLRPADEPSAATRRPLLSLRVGEVLEGTVCGMSLATGVHVDVGARYNGLLPVKSDALTWTKGLKGKLRMGDKCRVRVAKIIYAPLCRFPLVLEVEGEEYSEIRDAFVPTDEYHGAFDLRGAPDSNSDLRGAELAEVMDQLTGGAWSGGADYEVAAIPVPSGGAARGNMVDAHRRALDAEVEGWLERAGLEAKARARSSSASSTSTAGSSSRSRKRQQRQQQLASSSSLDDDDGDDQDGGGGDETGDDDNDASEETDDRRRRRRRDEYDGDGDEPLPGMFLEEGVEHSDLDGAIAGLF